MGMLRQSIGSFGGRVEHVLETPAEQLGVHGASHTRSVLLALFCGIGLSLLAGCSAETGDGGDSGGGDDGGSGEGSGDGHDDGDDGPPTHEVDEGDRVASLTLQAPSESRFLLRATYRYRRRCTTAVD